MAVIAMLRAHRSATSTDIKWIEAHDGNPVENRFLCFVHICLYLSAVSTSR